MLSIAVDNWPLFLPRLSPSGSGLPLVRSVFDGFFYVQRMALKLLGLVIKEKVG